MDKHMFSITLRKNNISNSSLDDENNSESQISK